MSDADWIGNAPENPWWADDLSAVYYEQKRMGEDVRDRFRLSLDSGAATQVDRAVTPLDPGPLRAYDRRREHVAWIDDGDLFLKRLAGGTAMQVTRSVADESAPVFSANGNRLFFERDGQFWAFALEDHSLRQVTDVRAEDDPDKESGFDALRAHQLRTYSTVVEDRRRADEVEAAEKTARSDRPAPLYLGADYEIVSRYLSPGGELEQVADLDGVSSFVLAPDDSRLLVLRSTMDRHADLYLGNADGSGEPRQLTDTVSERYAGIDWVVPQIVEVPSSHSRRPIYSKLFLPADFDAGRSYPAVMFVHGAGYTQNVHMGWPYYFREFMFHTVLADAGYVVLDMDYRASRGYGRDWRMAIYRNMGHPELEDYLDGIEYLVGNFGVDRACVGIYGGSYGGFMTLMALFRAPEAFAAGAALRPVADWMHYNDSYTARILNPPLIDPEAYQRSSPITHVAGLQKPLLIAVGMQDDNVFFQDSVQVVQRLIELHKENFEIAIYPLDAHSFVHPDSWLDEYRRIFWLMETHLK